MSSTGLLLRNLTQSAKKSKRPIQLVGAVNAYSAILAQKIGHKALYLSGGGVAASSLGLPDLGISTLEDVLIDVNRLTRVSSLPLLVDVDTGFGTSAFNIKRTISDIEKAGAAGVHIEDQVAAKRCGHRPGKQIVTSEEMVDRILSAKEGRKDPNFVIMARTDAFANEGMDSALKRAREYVKAGADMLFPEALTELKQYKEFTDAFPDVPVLANITEFGKTPLFTVEELGQVGVSIVLYPLSAFRAQSAASIQVYESILNNGSQSKVLDLMQTREELYGYLDYHSYEKKLDALFDKEKKPK
eukprot:TRINITY_DN3874_c0_g1_i1.p1 TRINITY_DN3874_c0_g1~~TRINITY_DN3874_c0_g1_i1.p1  ORF type:complete len:334 (-),score=80.90 TRINITY_DN3874_c0_g1_i1:100-1002(-)